jgi:type I restriction enzyme S subunit
MEGRELPVGWELIRLSEAAEWGSGGTPSRRNLDYYGGKIPWIKTGELGPRHITRTEETISDLGLANSSAKIFPEGSIAIAMYGATIGKVSILGVPAATNQACAVAAVNLGVCSPEFFYHYLCSQRDEFVKAGKGGAQPNVSQGLIKDWPIPLAPLNEQRRIAAKLDTTLAAVEACRQRLDGVAAILKRFRQAVLTAATSGELTREWREERGLADFWKTKVLSEIADSRLGKMLDQRKNTGQLTPYLRNINVRWFSFDLEDIQEIRLADTEIIDLDVRFGDLLVCEGGEPGRCAVWRGEDSKYTFQKALHRVRTSKHLLADYLSFCLSNSANNGKLEQLFTGSTIKHLTGASLKKLQILLPSREEQEEIVDRVESLYSLADQLEARLTIARKVVDRLTPALLAKAFRGELVPKDPGDEPASVLLERIRAARQAEAGAGKPSRRGRPKAAANPDQLPLDAAPVPPDFLAGLLRECGPLSERALLAVSELEPQRFQQQLYRELESGTAREVQDNGQVLLEAVG